MPLVYKSPGTRAHIRKKLIIREREGRRPSGRVCLGEYTIVFFFFFFYLRVRVEREHRVSVSRLYKALESKTPSNQL